MHRESPGNTQGGKTCTLRNLINIVCEIKIMDKIEFDRNINELVRYIATNLHEDPKSEFGISMGQRIVELIETLKGAELESVRLEIWKKGLGILQISDMSPEIMIWIEKAMDAFWRSNIDAVLAKSER